MLLRSRQFLLALVASLALIGVVAQEVDHDAATDTKILSKRHHGGSHAEIEEELRREAEDVAAPFNAEEFHVEDLESFTCTITGATGQDQCDAAQDDDGSKCVWCVLNSFGFCVSETQAETFKQVMPTIDCDDDKDDDKTPKTDDDAAPSPLWECLESKDEDGCDSTKCVWCNTKGGFGVCLTPEGAAMAADSYWFDCGKEFDEIEGDDDADAEYGEDEEEEEEAQGDDYGQEEDYEEGDDDGEEEEEDYEEEGEKDDLGEFVVDTSCVMAGILLDPKDDEATSEEACFQAKDVTGKPCEWCSVAGSPFRLCLSEPQAQVAEYVGATCSGSDESFEPEEFDDSCIAHQHSDPLGLTRHGCWQNKDLDGNRCEWCNVMGVELCLGGVQAELVEHWGATCVLDDEEHQMAEEAIQQHHEYMQAEKEARRQAQKLEQQHKKTNSNNPETNEDAQDEDEEEADEEELDLATLWLTSDPSCMITTLRTSNGDDPELACAKMQDKEGNPCNWCSIGTSFDMCLNDEQAEVAEYMGIECETISTSTQEILREHQERTEHFDEEGEGEEDEEEYDDDAEEEYDDDANEEGEYEDEEEEDQIDPDDLDPSCLMSMQTGPDEATCVATKDANGKACEWCTWGTINACLAAKQAEIVEPFGVTCSHKDATEAERQEAATSKTEFWSCLQHSQDGWKVCAKESSCTWCNTASGVGICLSESAAEAASELEFFDCIMEDEDDEEADKENAEPAKPKELQQGPNVDTSCLIDAGKFGEESKCVSSKDAISGQPCEWCTLGSLGVNACMSAAQAQMARALGVTCNGEEAPAAEAGEEVPILKEVPADFFTCLSQSITVDDCSETCTWCDVKGATDGSGLCLSDPVADVLSHFTGDLIVDCTEPEPEQNFGDLIVEAVEGSIA